MKKIALEIVALSPSVSQNNNYAILLQENEGSRRLPIVIGGFEAQAIAVALERMTPNRPLTHDLFKNALEIFNISLKEIIINNLLDGIFYARLICVKDNELIEIDSRTSDAIALAVRFSCPIYTYEFILDAAGIPTDDMDEEIDGDDEFDDDEFQHVPQQSSLSSYSLDALNRLLSEVLSEEDYERAALIRDEINRRKDRS